MFTLAIEKTLGGDVNSLEDISVKIMFFIYF